jgi:glucose/arabinose dehydrogenase
MKFRRRFFALALAAASAGSGCAAAQSTDEVLASLSLPPGYGIQVYAEVPDVRTLAVAEDLGLVFVGGTGGVLKALADKDGDGRAEVVLTVASGLNAPHGIAYHDGFLYVAELHRVSRYDLSGFGGKLPAPQVLFDGLPDKSHHGRRVAVVGADGLLYVAVGTPCNICQPKGLEGSILRLPLTGGAPEIFARGVRNSVGIDVHPKTGVLHFTDNGGDNLGDDLPPEELNAAPRAKLHFGYPYYAGGDTRVRIAADSKLLSTVVFPVVTFPAHNAPLGLHFYRGRSLPLAGDALVALHGSWNRSVPDGYRVVRVRFDDDGQAQAWEPFIDGFLDGRRVLGRPVDIKTHWDGSLLITDDYRDLVYRVTYQGG